ncbi:ABC transporter permease [Paraglaciecola sp. 2405UD69-4]|uniref:ABC transporter permease n=1 Tax=Paraglaciecola sp. 2405UD69-4 TaxID=3391836 RepID=UPI0039C9E4F3
MILQSLKKELLIVFSDLHSIAVLFIMPLTFMLLMTFAMSGREADILSSISIYTEQQEPKEHEKLYLNYLADLGYQFSDDADSATASLTFNHNFNDNVLASDATGLINIKYSSNASLPIQTVIQQHLELSFARVKLHLYMLETEELDADLPLDQQMQLIIKQSDTSELITTSTTGALLPVISYSIPSWLVFGIFFIVLPISITLVNENQSGTLIRLKTFPINMYTYFFTKLAAFYCISLAQFLVLLIIGLRLVPLVIDSPPVAYSQILHIIPLGLFICLSAVCFASIFSALVKTFEQAIVLGGGVNIILAALSGFMVPLDVMPPSLQQVAQWSPMYWAADIVKQNMFNTNIVSSMEPILLLCLFSLVSLGVASFLFSRKIRDLLWN